MKKIATHIIGFYQIIISPLLGQALGVKNSCRFSPTCSQYAKEKILETGIFKGSWLSVIRILKCQPFYNQDKKERVAKI